MSYRPRATARVPPPGHRQGQSRKKNNNKFVIRASNNFVRVHNDDACTVMFIVLFLFYCNRFAEYREKVVF